MINTNVKKIAEEIFSTKEVALLETLSRDKNYSFNEFMSNYFNIDEIIISIFEYRKYLLSLQENSIIIDDIVDILSSKNGNDKKIKLYFEKIFLEPFVDTDIKIIKNSVNKKDKVQKLIDIHNNNKFERLMSILTKF